MTEPIGFKGTEGEWICQRETDISIRIYLDDNGNNAIDLWNHTDNKPEQWANAHLVLASKSMAIALQKYVEHIKKSAVYAHEHQIPFQIPELFKEAKEALKNAGL